MSTAFDYATQRWVTGPRAETLLSEQRAEVLDILRSGRGQEYLDFVRRRGEPRRFVADVLREMRELP